MEKPEYRRFIPIGTEMDKFESLVSRKNLSRENLFLILESIKINPNISAQDR